MVSIGSRVKLTWDWQTGRKASTSSMITSTLNGITKWPGPGNSAYDAAAAVMGDEVCCASLFSARFASRQPINVPFDTAILTYHRHADE